MQLPYFFEENLQQDEFDMSEEGSRHIIQVLRMKEGDRLQITDGRGNLVTATIVQAHKKHCGVRVNLRQEDSRLNRPRNIIAVSILKNSNRLEWFMEKATETGIASIVPLICERTEKNKFRMDRMRSILISAMLQSRQTHLPNLYEPIRFQQVFEILEGVEEKYIAHCDEGDKASLREQTKTNGVSRAVLIGPEGDFTSEEIKLAVQKGCLPVHLGGNRLRTETAAVAAAVFLNL